MKNNSLVLLFLIALLIVLLWITAPNWLDRIFPGIDKGQLENLFSPINALFGALALLGLIYTIIQQQRGLELQREDLKATREELHATAEANQTIVSDSKVTALINLYLFFYDANNFAKTRGKAWNVLQKMIVHEDYFLFVFDQEVRAAKGYKPVSEKHWHQFQKIFSPNAEMTFESFKETESDFRHKFDDLLNFYNLLSMRSMPKELFQKVNFYYDEWRQPLWWFAFKVEGEFDKDENLRRFCSLATLSDSLRKLDKLLDFDSPQNLQDVLEFAIIRDTLNRKPEIIKG